MTTDNVIVITGASSGFGALTARTLALAGHNVYAGMRETTEPNADLGAIEMDVSSEESVDAPIAQVPAGHDRIDVLIHNAGHMVTGPAEAFTPEQLAELYDVNVLSTQRVNRAALPGMRARGAGLVIWVSSSSVKWGTPPDLGQCFPSKAGMDSLAVSCAGGLAGWGVEPSIVVPGSFTSGPNPFARSGSPADKVVEAEYETKYAGL